MRSVYVLLTMDCEPPNAEVTAHARAMSSSGPASHRESEQAILGYAEVAASYGFPCTFFVHPEVAAASSDLMLDLQRRGACLGLHVHPYKLAGGRYLHDLGAYSASQQRAILGEAMDSWESALGEAPKYFRAGYFSANDATFGVLADLGFEGGSVSIPGRVLPCHYSVWAGADLYPHRAHVSFRLVAGDSSFVEVPVSVALDRPVACGHAGERGFEWLYVPHSYDHASVVRSIVRRLPAADVELPTLVADTHNDHDYTDRDCPASRNLHLILSSIRLACESTGLRAVGTTLAALCGRVLAT